MSRSSGQHVQWFVGRLEHGCGYSGLVDWQYDPEEDRTVTYATCPECDSEVMQATSEGNF